MNVIMSHVMKLVGEKCDKNISDKTIKIKKSFI